MDDGDLTAPPDAEFKLVIDYPFDDAGHGPDEDERRIAKYSEGHRSPTVVWLPNFLGDRVKKDLMELVVIDRILDDPLRSYLAHLRPDDQRRAREELEHLRAQKTARVRRALEGASGLKRPDDGDLDPAHEVDKHIHVLWPGWEIRGVTESVLDRAVDKAVEELLALRYPRHPYFPAGSITPAKLRAALERLEKLCEAEGQRLPITRQERGDWEVLEQLKIVEVTEAFARLRPEWLHDVGRILLQDAINEAPTVDQIRKRLDPGGQRGLLAEVADLEAMVYAIAARREILRGGAALKEPTLGKLPGDAELVEAPLPDERVWQEAVDRAGKLFGIALPGRARNARNLRQLFEKVQAARVAAVRDRADALVGVLGRRAGFLPEKAPRLATAECAAALLARIDTKDPVELAQALGTFEVGASSWPSLQRHIQHAAKVGRVLEEEVYFNVFEELRHSEQGGAQALLAQVTEALGADELNVDLAARLPVLSAEGQQILRPRVGTAEAAAEELVARADGEGLEGLAAARDAAAEALAKAGPGGRLVFSWKVLKRK
jgi:hypothetical protein